MYTMVNMHMYIHMNEIHTIHIQYRDEIKKKKRKRKPKNVEKIP